MAHTAAQEALAESKDSLSASQAIRAALGGRQESLEGKLAQLRDQAEEVRGVSEKGFTGLLVTCVKLIYSRCSRTRSFVCGDGK